MAAHGIFLGDAWGKHGADLMSYVDGFTAAVGAAPHIYNNFHRHVPDPNWPQGGPFPTEDCTLLRDRGIQPMISWGNGVQGGGSSQPGYTNATYINGDHDAYLTQFAEDAKAFGTTILLRYCWEMDSLAQPYSVNFNGNLGMAEFIQMWQHVHGIFESVGADNVKWVWCPTNGGFKKANYVGNAYVDYLAWDIYFSNEFHWSEWNYLDAHVNWQQCYKEAIAINPTKKILIPEYGVNDSGGDSAMWLLRFFRTSLARFPNVVGHIYFNGGGADIGQWFLDTDPHRLKAYAQAIAAVPSLDGSLS